MDEESNAETNRKYLATTRWSNSPYAYIFVDLGAKLILLSFLELLFSLVIFVPLIALIFGVGPTWESLVGTGRMFGDFGGFVAADFAENPWKYLFGFGALYALIQVYFPIRYNAPEPRIVPRYVLLAVWSGCGFALVSLVIMVAAGEQVPIELPIVGPPSVFMIGMVLFVASLFVSRGLHNTIVEDKMVHMREIPVVIVWRLTARMGVLYMAFVGLFGLPGVFSIPWGYATLCVPSLVAIVYVIQRVVHDKLEKIQPGDKNTLKRRRSIRELNSEVIEEQGDDGFRR